MPNTGNSSVVSQLFLAIENGQMLLPTLPDVAIKIQQMLDDMDIPVTDIVSAISRDPVIVAQLIRAANSALYADKPRVDNARDAISRLGFRALRNQVMTITMARLSKAELPAVKALLNNLWEHSREVATLSYFIADSQKHLNADQAMLAGLIHDIGTLPLCIYVDKMNSDLGGDILDELILRYRSTIGEKLLQTWGFPEELVEVIPEHENLQRITNSHLASYADVVTVANLLNRVTAKSVPWENITARQRLHLSPEICLNFHDRFGNEILTVHEKLFPN